MDLVAPPTAIVTNSLSQCHTSDSASVNVARLLDGLMTKFDKQPAESFQSPNHPQNQIFGDNLSSAPRFASLPTEIQHLIFGFCFRPFVLTIYHEDWQKVQSSRDVPDTDPPSRRIMFINYRSPRTIPLLHVCRASRHLAVRRYGLPSPARLLFDPTIDQICHGGQWPFASVKPWHIFSVDKEPICDFSSATSMQLRLSAFCADMDLCIPPDSMFDMTEAPNPYSSTSHIRFAVDVTQTLGWILNHLPHLRELIFTLPIPSQDKQIDEARYRAQIDLINIRTALVFLEEKRGYEQRPNYLGQLSKVCLCFV